MKTIWQKLNENTIEEEFTPEFHTEGKICRCLREMRDRESDVLRFRFALPGYSFRTLKELALHYDVSSENIRQREAKGIRQLRWLLRNMK